MALPIFQIDAFTGPDCAGNPAAVVPLTQWPDERLLQFIAEENNLSETAFIAQEGAHHRLRWFTPTTELPLCGHATLAAAYCLWTYLGATGEELHFLTHSGQLTARRAGELTAIELPEDPAVPAAEDVAEPVWRAIGCRGEAVLQKPLSGGGAGRGRAGT